MFSKKPNFYFILGGIVTIVLYVVTGLFMAVLVATLKAPTAPIESEVFEARTYRTPSGITFKFSAVTNADKDLIIHAMRSVSNEGTHETMYLPALDIFIEKGNQVVNAVGYFPPLDSGIWEYQRMFTYRPPFSMTDKVVAFPPMKFKVCDKMYEECRM